MHYIYKTTNTINGRVYIGQRHVPGHGNIERDSYLGSGTLLLDAIKRYGRVNFTKEILHICETQKQADELEIDEIRKHRKELGRINVYNMSNGGQFWREDGHSEQVSETMKAWYSVRENKKSYIAKVNIARIKKGLPTLEEQRDIRDKQRNEYLDKRMNEKLKRMVKRQEQSSYRQSNEYQKMIYNKRSDNRKKVFYRDDVLEKFKAGIKARDSRPEFKAQRKINAQLAADTSRLNAKIAAFGNDHKYYLTVCEFADFIGVSRPTIDNALRDGRRKADAYIHLIGKRCAVFDIRLYQGAHSLQQTLF